VNPSKQCIFVFLLASKNTLGVLPSADLAEVYLKNSCGKKTAGAGHTPRDSGKAAADNPDWNLTYRRGFCPG
jgi:hypothetical protein